MEPYARHVLVCVGGFCSPNREGRMLYAELARLLQREGLLFGPRRVKRGETPCLGVCAGGPIVVVYPEGVWYAGVTSQLASTNFSVLRVNRDLLSRSRIGMIATSRNPATEFLISSC